MRRLHPLTLAMLATIDPATLAPSAGKVDPQRRLPAPTEPLRPLPELPPSKGRPVRDLLGRPMRAVAQPERRPSGDQNPEGKAAKRRRKQMERKNPPAKVQHAADSCEVLRADRQDLVRDMCLDGGAIETWMNDDGEIQQRYVPRAEMTIVDEASEVPPEVWLTESNPQPDRSWVQEYIEDFTNSREQWKPDATDENIARCQTRCAWKGGSRCLADDCPRKARGEEMLDRLHKRSREMVMGSLNAVIERELTGGQEVRTNVAGNQSELRHKGEGNADVHTGLQPLRDPDQSEGGRGQ